MRADDVGVCPGFTWPTPNAGLDRPLPEAA